MDIHTLLRGLAAELAAVEVEPALGAVEVDGVDHGSYACGLAVVVALIAFGSRQADSHEVVGVVASRDLLPMSLLADISSVAFVAFDVAIKYIATHRGNSVIAGLQDAGFIFKFYHTHGWFLIIAFHIAECLFYHYLELKFELVHAR